MTLKLPCRLSIAVIGIACVGFLSLISLLRQHTVQGAPQKAESLNFHRVITEKSLYDKSPGRFEIFKSTSGRESYELYIERVPSLTIPIDEITAVTIGKQKIYGGPTGVEEIIKDLKRPPSAGKSGDQNFPFGFIYTATFALSEKGKKAFQEFAKQYDGQHFDCRLGKHSLSIAQIVGPAGASDKFNLSLSSKEEKQLKEVFAPISDRTKWI